MVRRTKHNKYSHRIDAELDLHGATREEALRIVAGFLHEERVRGSAYVRVVVGKGTHSHGGESVLAPAVKSWLVGHGYAYTFAKLAEGGEGALEVRVDTGQ